ncbi:methyltransferase domain-containing protein [Acinetobacter seifertii]|uniref:Methyltransferase domain-containing protein n=1 Tax=Acinetobacter seifertii TaxID=1530123 RepID=A0A7H2QCV6_9GAMM|nr:methyltransferase domain-containing protein [Acinetobacter seifertii]MDB0281157.1 SAM-dependent methyltransferase [Acinetobacter seifertii]QNX12939.1 methyltransferase domain-containing protein [Acinetobacter seifertii]QNX19124.1 methyltransferase domain-containing protein [Acinetobacter seifertii]QNX25732.1 methyltransferase domain-containing protein [Acinetobacter seifertii]QNX36758.1 methyltransferase domain-containing protein [Acinetobacter seifertii]
MNEKFIQLSRELKHRPILEKALGHFPNLPLIAIDCGCGAGNESAYLLSKGFNVHAFDISIDAQKFCAERFKDDSKFIFYHESFENFNFPSASLIIASSSLFFCEPSYFYSVIKRMINALPVGGILVVDLLGTHDEWVIKEPAKFIGFTYQDIVDLFLYDFNLLFHKEMNENLPLLNGYIKSWHLHMLILQKK